MTARSTMRYSYFNQHKLNELIRLEVLVLGNTFELYIQNSLLVLVWSQRTFMNGLYHPPCTES